ncbi:MAG: methyltransferase domain-containing protein [Candidatus Xenobium sp.]|nr:methyltransferase domain-containing protein [Burkholderiales bacterium]
MRATESLELVGVGLANVAWVTTRTGIELLRFGRSSWWWRLRWALLRTWVGQTPIGVVRREGPASGLSEEDLVYGETLPGTAFDLLEALEVEPRDIVVDLGCGRGVFPLVAGLAFQARAVGLEVLEGFVTRGRRAARLLGLEGVDFQQGDFRKAPLPQGTVYFLAGTCLEPSSWAAVTRNLADATPPKARAASLSQSLPSAEWEDLGCREMAFSWGKATVFLHRRRPSPRRARSASQAHARSKGSTDPSA